MPERDGEELDGAALARRLEELLAEAGDPDSAPSPTEEPSSGDSVTTDTDTVGAEEIDAEPLPAEPEDMDEFE